MQQRRPRANAPTRATINTNRPSTRQPQADPQTTAPIFEPFRPTPGRYPALAEPEYPLLIVPESPTVTPPSTILLAAVLLIASLAAPPAHAQAATQADPTADDQAPTIRIALFNIQDLRLHEIADPTSERMHRVIAILRDIDADVIAINEIHHDGVIDPRDSSELVPPQSARVLARRIATDPERSFANAGIPNPTNAPTPKPITYTAVQLPSNTGVHSGLDLDRNNTITDRWGTRDRGGDCLGYGEFPGQYAMALLVRESLTIDTDNIRTFANLRWNTMLGALLPNGDGQRVPVEDLWYTDDMLDVMRLSSKSHWDIPVIHPDLGTVHILLSHPTPPVFDGPDDRNGKRNHDEIRFWAEYTNHGTAPNTSWLIDDNGRTGPLPDNAHYVITGDLNAEPKPTESESLRPIERWFERTGTVHPDHLTGPLAPTSNTTVGDLDPALTAHWGRRVDYVLPGPSLTTTNARVWRSPADSPTAPPNASATFSAQTHRDWYPSDHYAVWADITLRETHQSR